jgi:chloramphenicol-sensitive protein RarD
MNRTGLAAGVAAYLLWGLFPLYWPLLEPAGSAEILAHRVVWSFVFLVGVLAATSGFRWLATLGRPRARLLALAAVLVTANWGVFIYGVNSGHVVETSLGYFINPLVSVTLGVLVLGERLTRAQRIAVGIAAVAVVVLAVDYGRPPWIALTLAGSFGGYGLIKNRVGMEGTPSVAIETAYLLLPALGFIAWLEATGRGTFTDHGGGLAALIAAGGVVTAVPLMLFGAAAIRIPLSTVGVLQYITPSMHWGIGVFVRGEPMPPARLAGFALVWVALGVFTVDAVRRAQRRRRLADHEHVEQPRPVDALHAVELDV